MQAKRYLRPDTNEIAEVLPGLGNHCFIVGTRKANGSIKKFKSQHFPPFRSRALLQKRLDKWVADNGGKWPLFADPPACTREAMDLKAAKAARKKWKVGDLVRICNGEQYDGQLGRIYCVPSAGHPTWLYTVTLLIEGQEHTSDHCRYDEMELVEEKEMPKIKVVDGRKKLNTPFRDLVPPLSKVEFEVLQADIKAHGVQVPVAIDEDDNILDGHHRYECDTAAPTVVIRGLTELEKKAYVIKANVARRNLSPDQKKELRKKQQQLCKELKAVKKVHTATTGSDAGCRQDDDSKMARA